MRLSPLSLFAHALVLFALQASRAEAVVYRAGSLGGLMLQPSSAYYHAVYGGYGEVSNDSLSFIVRGAYVERPKFSANGYVDQDYGSFAMLGSKVTKTTSHGLLALVGYGQMGGYMKSTHEEDTVHRRAYSLPGPTAALEYGVRWKNVDLAVSHQTFIGFADSAQTEAYVAWPYNFFFAHIGCYW